jgi:hypothetical protein
MSRRRGRPGKKAVVRGEVLERLKGGASIAELLREFSPGPVYDAVREYLSFVAGEVEEARKSRERESLDLANIRDEYKSVKGDVAEKKVEVQKLVLSAVELGEEIKGKEKSVSELELRTEQLEKKLDEYSKRGISDATFRRLERFSFGDEDELIQRLDTAEMYRGFLSETESLKAELPGLRKNIIDLRDSKTALESEINRLKVARDKELNINYVQGESIRILGTFYEAGYTSEDIEGIRLGLDTLGIAGDPKTSVKNLIEVLQEERRLEWLWSETAAKTEELKEIEADIEITKVRLFAIRDIALSSIVKVETASKDSVKQVGDEAISNISALGEAGEKQLKDVSENNVKAVGEAARAGLGNLIDIHNQAKSEIEETAGAVVDEVRGTIRSEFEPYRDALKLIPQMRSFTDYGYLLMRVPNDKLVANKVPAFFVYLMAASIDSWIREMMPEAMTKPPEDLNLLYAAAGTVKTASLFMISTWLRNELMMKTRFA